MMKVQVNYSQIVKKHYFLAFVLWFPPVHELGHIVICWFLGSEVTYVDWWSSIRHVVTSWDWVHTVWELTTWIVPIFFVLLWGYFNIHRSRKQVINTQ